MAILICIFLSLICYLSSNTQISEGSRNGGMVVFILLTILCLIL